MSEPHLGDLVRLLDTITGVLASLSVQPPEGREVFHDALCEAVAATARHMETVAASLRRKTNRRTSRPLRF